jgi:signal transduction histidine kinase
LLVAALAWSAVGGIFALPFILRGGGYGALLAGIINWWLWGALIPLISHVDDRLSARCRRSAWLVMAHAGFGLSLTVLYVAVAAPLEFYLGLNQWNPWTELLGLLDWLMWAFLVYCLILGVLKAVKYYRRHLLDELALARLERRLLETRLNALRMQLDPHFLFNTLNGISAYVAPEPRLARKMIEHLAELLRLSLATRDRQLVTVAEEVDFLEHYLALHRTRFGERLAVSVSVAPQVAPARIPSLLLQPLVENAIKHGIAGRVEGGAVTIAAWQDGDRLRIRVADDGVGLPPGWQMDHAHGVGLSVTRERLLASYAEGSEFALRNGDNGGAEVSISVPLLLYEKESHAHNIHH